MIPFNDLQRLNKSIFKEIERELQTLVNKGSFILSKEVELFEEDYKNFTNTKYFYWGCKWYRCLRVNS